MSAKDLIPFKPGQTGNPGGKPTGARNRLTAAFLNALAADFDEHGKKAIQECRETKPEAYIKAIAALCPKVIEVERPLQEMEDAELLAAVRALEGFLASRANEAGATEAGERTPAH